MLTYLLCLWVTMVLLLSVSAVPMLQRHRLTHNEKEVVNKSSPLSDAENNLMPANISTPASIKEDSPDAANGTLTRFQSESFVNVKNDFPSLSIDDFYDYDYLNYFYDLDFLDPITSSKTLATAEQRTAATNAAIKMNQNKATAFQQDTFLRHKENKNNNSAPIEEQEKRKTLTKQNLFAENENSIHIEPTPDYVKNDLDNLEQINVIVSNTTSISTSLPNSSANNNINQKNIENLNNTNSGWKPSGSSVSFEVRVSSSLSGPKYKRNFVLLNEDLNSKAVNNNYQMRETLELEVSATPSTINLERGKSISRNAKRLFDAGKGNFEDNRGSEFIQSKTSQNPSSLPVYENLTFTSSKVPTTSKPVTTTQNQTSSTMKHNLVTREFTSAAPKSFLSTTLKPITESHTKSTGTTTTVVNTPPSPPVNDPTKRRPFAFLRRLSKGKERKLNLPPLFPRYLSTEIEKKVKQEITAKLTESSTKSVPKEQISENKKVHPQKNATLNKTPQRRRQNISSKSRKRTRNLVPQYLRSQLGKSPHGINPSGVTPLGQNPQGSSPFGLSPHGVAPHGVFIHPNLTSNNVSMPNVMRLELTNKTNATDLTTNISNTPDLTTNKTNTPDLTNNKTIATDLTNNKTNMPDLTNNKTDLTNNKTDIPDLNKERYHVQVKKPDGSINGDYIVLNHQTGSLSGVRYDAINGADQSLIQQALLSFLSLGPHMESSRREKSLSVDLKLEPVTEQKSLDSHLAKTRTPAKITHIH